MTNPLLFEMTCGIACTDCDAYESDLPAAIAAGWSEIYPDECALWAHVGKCPECIEEQKE